MKELIQAQYQRWPYPSVPLFGRVRSLEVFQLHLDHLRARVGLPPSDRARIWIAGCGTMQPYIFGKANPKAEILASDLSESSLKRAQWRCWLNGVGNVSFRQIDLEEELPSGPFELIECYGVLMNLQDPAAILRRLAERLAPNGILRLMVYPWYSRRRVFQLQRVARLLGLIPPKAEDPAKLRAIVRALPQAHPLRYAFESYSDARNDIGIVDAFLHAGDRGFTALHLGELAEKAGLEAAFWFHRPWARPEILARELGLKQWSAPQLLHYADLWQELRGNLVPMLVRKGAGRQEQAERLHPALGRGSSLRAALGRLSGLELGNRLGEGRLRLSATELRALDRGKHPREATLREAGVLIGAPEAVWELPTTAPFPPKDREPVDTLEIGEQAANPFYAHLLRPFRYGRRHPELGTLAMELSAWEPFSDPLEDPGAWGLTPMGTWKVQGPAIERWLEEENAAADSLSQIHYPEEDLGALRHFLSPFDLPKRLSPLEERELWLLLGSWKSLFVKGEER